MDTITTGLRSARREGGERRDYLETFREFIEQLNRASRRRDAKTAKKKTPRDNKR